MLFGAPHLDAILGGYAEAAPLVSGWCERVSLHQLHPLMVHAVLFQGGYVAQSLATARLWA
jgi:fructosamine-3-kinase